MNATKLKQAATKLGKLEGVVGVFWGHHTVGGEWMPEPKLVVHVKGKRRLASLPRGERIPSRVHGFATDVMEVGVPRVHQLDAHDQAEGSYERVSTITAVASYQGSSLVLTSGHGVSPFRGTNMVRRIDPTDARERYAIRDFNGVRIAAEIIKARLANGWSLDYALASAAESEPLESHRANDRRPPFAIRRSALSFGDRVSHYSTLRHRRIDGSIEQVALDETSFSMPYPETREGRYQRVMVIRNDGATRFSEPGDSGSMIVDWTGEVVGTVLGSSDGADIAYALPIAGLRGQLDEWATVFFKDGE